MFLENPSYEFSGKLSRFPGENGWVFLELPIELSDEIRSFADQVQKVGWWYIKVRAVCGHTTWDTTLFPTKKQTYFLAIKKSVREKEKLQEWSTATVVCEILMK